MEVPNEEYQNEFSRNESDNDSNDEDYSQSPILLDLDENTKHQQRGICNQESSHTSATVSGAEIVFTNSAGAIPRASDPEEAKAAFPGPDLSQMIPYDPKVNTLPEEHPVPGGAFPSPPARAIPRASDPEEAKAAFPRPDLSQMIPYDPKVNTLPEEHPVPVPLPVADNGCDTNLFDLAKSVDSIVDENSDGTGIDSELRRMRLNGDDSEE